MMEVTTRQHVRTRLKKRLRPAVVKIIVSLIVFGVTYYGNSITRQRIHVLKHGTLVASTVTQTTGFGNLKTFWVSVNNVERDGGTNFGQYNDLDVGDLVQVKYIPESRYVVPQGVIGYRSMLEFQYFMLLASGILFLITLLSNYKEFTRLDARG